MSNIGEVSNYAAPRHPQLVEYRLYIALYILYILYMPRRAYDTEEITGEKFDRIIFSITIDYITVWTRPEINNVIGQDSVVSVFCRGRVSHKWQRSDSGCRPL